MGDSGGGCSAPLRCKEPLSLNLGGVSVKTVEFVGCLPRQVFPSEKLWGRLLKKFSPLPWPPDLVLRTPHHHEFPVAI